MNDLKIFNNPEFGKIRLIEKDGETWWVAKDVCRVFGETNRNRAMQALDEDEKGYTQIDTPGGAQRMAIINEAGLYHLLFAMQPEMARDVTNEYVAVRQNQLKAFKRWVTHEVLPSIRKTGGYQMGKLPPEVSPLALSKLINSTRRVMLDMGCSALEIGAMVQSIFTSWNIPVPYTLAKNIPEQLSIYDMPTLQGS